MVMNPQQGGQNPQHPPPGGTPGYNQSVNSSGRANRFLETPVQHPSTRSNQLPAPAAPSRYHQYSIGSAVSGGGGSASAPRFGVGGGAQQRSAFGMQAAGVPPPQIGSFSLGGALFSSSAGAAPSTGAAPAASVVGSGGGSRSLGQSQAATPGAGLGGTAGAASSSSSQPVAASLFQPPERSRQTTSSASAGAPANSMFGVPPKAAGAAGAPPLTPVQQNPKARTPGSWNPFLIGAAAVSAPAAGAGAATSAPMSSSSSGAQQPANAPTAGQLIFQPVLPSGNRFDPKNPASGGAGGVGTSSGSSASAPSGPASATGDAHVEAGTYSSFAGSTTGQLQLDHRRESNLPLTPTGGQPGGNPGSCIFGVHELAPQERSSSDGCNHDVEHDPEKFGLPRSVRQTPVGAGGPQGGARGRHSRTGGRGGEDVTGRPPRDSFEFDLLADGRGGAAEAKISSGGGGSPRSSSGGHQQQQADRAGRAPKTAGSNSEASLIMVRRLRRKVQAAFQSHLHQTATFLADKVLCMTGDLEDLYTLAECYYQNREYARVIFLLTQKYPAAEVVSKGPQGQDRLKLLVVQSYLEAREFEEALRYLDEHCLPSGVGIERFEQGEHKAVFAFLKGKVFEHFENREAAVNCYKLAVKYDAYLHEATAKLIGTGLLTRSEEQKLLGKMRFEDEFLPVLYDFKSAASSSSWAGGPGGKAKGYVPGPEAAGRRAGLQELATGGKGAASSTRGGAVVPGEAATGTGGSSATGAGSSGANISSAAAGAEEDVTMGERNTLKNAAGDYSTALAPGRTRRKRNSLEPLEDCKSEYPLTVLPENLHTNAFVLSSVAEKFFQTGDYTASYLVSKKILERDPYELDALPCHIASLLMLENKTLVFYIAHQLMNAYPHSPVAWFAAGCYYFMAGRYECARKFFGKATLVDHNFAPAWIAYGHAFAMQEESDQALAAYRTAGRLFPASHLPHLFLGMEYVRTSNLVLGEQALKMGLSAAPEDPALWNELGVCAFEKQDYRQAVELFRRAHSSLAGSATDTATEVDTLNLESSTTLESSAITTSPSAVELEETVVDNLAHAYLKCGDYENALVFFQRALNLCVSATAYGGVAFVKQLQGDVHAAIEGYHKALALHPDDVFCQEMLNYAVQEAASMLTA